MKRNLTFEEISDGKRYSSSDLAKIGCGDCAGCFECCKVTEDTIHLDPYDIYSLSVGLGHSFAELMGSSVNLTVVDGVVTPYLTKRESDGVCGFLSKEGRCTIHDFRPGFCRLFPLGRIYNDDGSFDYFIQVHECPYPAKTKVKIKSWLGIPSLSRYEAFVRTWHEITANIRDCAAENPGLTKEANLRMLKVFFETPYNAEEDFYSQFEERVVIYQGA